MPEPTSYKPDILRRALDNLLRRKAYHMAPPSKKNIMVLKEYSRILKNKQLSHYTWKKELTKE
jgi:hypothetical protein